MRPGFIRAIALTLRVVEDGLLIGGPPCGPWVFVNSGTHKRKIKNIFGDPKSSYVKRSNVSFGKISGLFCGNGFEILPLLI